MSARRTGLCLTRQLILGAYLAAAPMPVLERAVDDVTRWLERFEPSERPAA